MAVFFVDTNFFLEFKKSTEVDWTDVSADDPIDLIVPAAVVTEINNHKGKGSSRKAKRARDVSSEFRKVILSPDGSIILREKGPRVTLGFAPLLKPDYSKWPILDREVPDHQIIAEVATYIAEIGPAQILTDDTNVVVSARAVAIRAQLLPESWQLDPEADEQEKEIKKLKEELKKVKDSKPNIKLSILHPDSDDEISQLTLRLKTYSDTPAAIERVFETLKQRHPIVTDFQMTPPNKGAATHPLDSSLTFGLHPFDSAWIAPSEDEITAYRENKYPEWLANVRGYLESMALKLDQESCRGSFSLSLENTGYANATSVRLTVSAYGNLVLLRRSSDDDEKVDKGLPSPPAPPTGHYDIPSFRHFGSLVGRYSAQQFQELQRYLLRYRN